MGYFTIRERWLIFWRTLRCKGAARMDKLPWLQWVLTGRYPIR